MLLDENYIFLDVDLDNKEDALAFIANKAEELKITDSSLFLLEALQKREKEFSTGLQDGFAIPHARSSSVIKPSILYLKTNKSIEWGSMDDKKVNCIFSLLVPVENEGNVHLQMLSKLATCLLEDDFKNRVKEEKDVKLLKDYIYKNMEE